MIGSGSSSLMDFSAFGQDTIDALYWTATEPKGKKREHIGVVAHLLLGNMRNKNFWYS